MITPTWQRHETLLSRCIPSVQAQSVPVAEHVIVSDGPDPELASREWPAGVAYSELPGHDPALRWGIRARLEAIERSRGTLIAYLDDDDAWRPDHVAVLTAALQSDPDAQFAYSRMLVHEPWGTFRFGDGPIAYGRIGTPMIMHRRGLLDVATWEHSLPSDDWDLVRRWLEAGTPYVSVDAVTVDYYPAKPIDRNLAVPASFPPWSKAYA